ncbi:hypothetical protein [Pseudomonas syringae]|uniref:hypothetical protein n=1 Tax=Pseudomonas syringae TaxID=317 RepID=UPI00040DBC98|nr:hypothetical protein [Pseudomonas syringae]
MEELQHHLQQLSGDLQTEIAAYVGEWSGISYIEITDKHLHAVNHLISIKRALLQPVHIEFANTPKEKMRTAPGNGGLVDLVAEVRSFIESIRALEEFKANLESLYARIKEQTKKEERQHAERLARETTQRQAEEAARAQAEAEETARRIAQEQAAQQRVQEAALQLAQRQIEEAERALAQRLAEEARVREAESRQAVQVTFGPEALHDVEGAIKILKDSIELAITGFSNAITAHGALDMSQLEAIQHMSATH